MKSNHLLAGLAVVLLGGALLLAFVFLKTGDSPELAERLTPGTTGVDRTTPLDSGSRKPTRPRRERAPPWAPPPGSRAPPGTPTRAA